MSILRIVALARRAVVAVLSLLILSLMGGWTAAADPYLLGPQDQVRLKIYEWRASRDIIFEWTALNDIFTVGPDGMLSLPFAGTLPAEGRTPEVLGGTIAQNLVRNMGLGHAPDVAVEVVRFRPFYILGHVMQPGEFPYRPGLNVLEAVGIAGGLRIRPDGLNRMEREIISGRGEVSQLSLSSASLLARRARLQAEMSDAAEIAFPPQLTARTADAAVGILMEQEHLLFDARRQGLTTQLRALDELKSFLERETSSLEKQLGFLDQQIESVREELQSITTLVEQGLAVAPRQLALERSLLQVQSDRLSAETGLLRARQEASRTEISIIELRNNRAGEVARELRDTEVALSEAERRSDTALLLLHESEAAAPRLAAMRAEAARAEPIYTIVRPAGNGAIELAAGETTAVQPGDTVKVEFPLPSDLEFDAPIAPTATGSLPAAVMPVAGDGGTVIR